MATDPRGTAASQRAFIAAAGRYWLSVFPLIRKETRRWHQRAEQIPSPELRQLALDAQRVKRGNIEGSAAFTAFAPRRWRASAVRAQVAFQSAYDYVDSLAEQPTDDALRNARQLHQALVAAVSPTAAGADYYAFYPERDDGGYLEEIIGTCRRALLSLPYQAAVAEPTIRFSRRIVRYQSLNLRDTQGGHDLLKQWASRHTPPCTGLRWWETAASAGSSLGLFALIAAATRPGVTIQDTLAIERAYWPWVGALHSLLDSMVDEAEDEAAGQRSLLSYYRDSGEAAQRLRMLTERSMRSISGLTDAPDHMLVLAGMASHYLTSQPSPTPTAKLAAPAILATIGALAKPTMIVFRARRTASKIIGRASSHGRAWRGLETDVGASAASR